MLTARLMAALRIAGGAVVARATFDRARLAAVQSRAFSRVFSSVVVFVMPLPSMTTSTGSILVFFALFLAQAGEPFSLIIPFFFGKRRIDLVVWIGSGVIDHESHLRADHHPFVWFPPLAAVDLDTVVDERTAVIVVFFTPLVIFSFGFGVGALVGLFRCQAVRRHNLVRPDFLVVLRVTTAHRASDQIRMTVHVGGSFERLVLSEAAGVVENGDPVNFFLRQLDRSWLRVAVSVFTPVGDRNAATFFAESVRVFFLVVQYDRLDRDAAIPGERFPSHLLRIFRRRRSWNERRRSLLDQLVSVGRQIEK